MNIITCDTGVASTFMGTPVIVDWDLDFFADTAYFGLVGDKDANTGSLMRLAFYDDPLLKNWSGVHTFYQTDQPVSISPVVCQLMSRVTSGFSLGRVVMRLLVTKQVLKSKASTVLRMMKAGPL